MTPTEQTVKSESGKNYPVCPKCQKPLDDRVPRGWFVKTFLFWLPLKRYRCYTCKGKYYLNGR